LLVYPRGLLSKTYANNNIMQLTVKEYLQVYLANICGAENDLTDFVTPLKLKLTIFDITSSCTMKTAQHFELFGLCINNYS